MNKKSLTIIGILVVLISLVVVIIFGNAAGELSDASKFKKEYESLNGKESSSGKKNRNITISKDNRFVYASCEDIIKMMDNKESFAVYFGFGDCPWCRSVLPTLIEVVNDLDIDKICYVDVKNIRDTLEVGEDGKVVTVSQGTDGYMKLLEKLDNVLSDYTLSSGDEKVSTGEKRIYAPNVISVLEGRANALTSGISDAQGDAYMELTSKMKKETYNKFKCTLECLQPKSTVCENKAC